MTIHRHGINFVVSLRERVSIDAVAREVGAALGVTLTESQERGLKNDYVGEVLGLDLWLRISDPATQEVPQRIALLGQPKETFGENTTWVDIGPYVAELLTARTGRAWTAGTEK